MKKLFATVLVICLLSVLTACAGNTVSPTDSPAETAVAWFKPTMAPIAEPAEAQTSEPTPAVTPEPTPEPTPTVVFATGAELNEVLLGKWVGETGVSGEPNIALCYAFTNNGAYATNTAVAATESATHESFPAQGFASDTWTLSSGWDWDKFTLSDDGLLTMGSDAEAVTVRAEILSLDSISMYFGDAFDEAFILHRVSDAPYLEDLFAGCEWVFDKQSGERVLATKVYYPNGVCERRYRNRDGSPLSQQDVDHYKEGGYQISDDGMYAVEFRTWSLEGDVYTEEFYGAPVYINGEFINYLSYKLSFGDVNHMTHENLLITEELLTFTRYGTVDITGHLNAPTP